MKAIQKGNEPPSLTNHRCSQHAHYDNYQDKDELRQYLVAEQGGICCYCMQRIYPDREYMKIEHWHCKDNYEDEQLDYKNLLAACLGNSSETTKKQPDRELHCDSKKGNLYLSRNPANSTHRVEELIHYRGDGRIVSSDTTFDKELNEVLNLNYSPLIRNRKAKLDGFLQSLGKKTYPRNYWQKTLDHWSDSSKQLEEYCGVVIYWLRKKIRSLPQ